MNTHIRWYGVFALVIGGLLTLMATIGSRSQASPAAGPWYVALSGSDSNDCLSPGAACATINGALNKSGFVAGDTILVATGTYTGTGSEVSNSKYGPRVNGESRSDSRSGIKGRGNAAPEDDK